MTDILAWFVYIHRENKEYVYFSAKDPFFYPSPRTRSVTLRVNGINSRMVSYSIYGDSDC